jgi:hypothetical protein
MKTFNFQASLDLRADTLAYLIAEAAENNFTVEEFMVQVLGDWVVASMALEKHIAEEEAAKDSYEMNVEKQVEEQLSS